jgi:hypothetical protein
MYNKREMILQVKEFLERNCDVIEIASRMKLDPSVVVVIIESIKGVIT